MKFICLNIFFLVRCVTAVTFSNCDYSGPWFFCLFVFQVSLIKPGKLQNKDWVSQGMETMALELSPESRGMTSLQYGCAPLQQTNSSGVIRFCYLHRTKKSCSAEVMFGVCRGKLFFLKKKIETYYLLCCLRNKRL